MMLSVRSCVLMPAVVLLSALAGAAVAQVNPPDSAPVHVAVADGPGWLISQGIDEPLEAGQVLEPGDRVAMAGGRAELVWPDGTVLFLDRATRLELLGERRVRLTEGRARVEAALDADQWLALDIETAAATVRLQRSGTYLVTLLQGTEFTDVEVTVLDGAALLINASGSMPVAAGEYAVAVQDGTLSYPRPAPDTDDAFNRWAEAQGGPAPAWRTGRDLPPALSPYGPVLDRYGSWDVHASYGAIWYPRVATIWRPYSHGRWRHRPAYGWTWYGDDPWAWPTHHYGRWGLGVRGWFWIPGRVWGPAWVSWGVTSGYVGWCPLGWDDRPVIGFAGRVGPGYYGAGRRYEGRYDVGHRDPWDAWTLIPASRFGQDDDVRHFAVDGRLIDRDVRAALVTQRIPPEGRGRPRGEAPASRAVPRSLPAPGQVTAPSWSSPSPASRWPADRRVRERPVVPREARPETPPAEGRAGARPPRRGGFVIGPGGAIGEAPRARERRADDSYDRAERVMRARPAPAPDRQGDRARPPASRGRADSAREGTSRTPAPRRAEPRRAEPRAPSSAGRGRSPRGGDAAATPSRPAGRTRGGDAAGSGGGARSGGVKSASPRGAPPSGARGGQGRGVVTRRPPGP